MLIEYDGQHLTVADGSTAIIGADTDATVLVSRPGISRRHAILKQDGVQWVVEDASSRNGTFHSGARIETLPIDGVTTIRLGHPAQGPEIVLIPSNGDQPTRVATWVSEPVPAAEPPPFQLPDRPPTPRPELDLDPRLDLLIDALNDTVSSVRGLTWSVWAMIAVTAALVVLTLFVAIIGN